MSYQPKFRICSTQDIIDKVPTRWFDDFFINADGKICSDYYEMMPIPNPEDYTISWSTGMKDKNGKEIYEGDLVTYGSPNHALIAVDESHVQVETKWRQQESTWVTYYEVDAAFILGTKSLIYLKDVGNIEIIGNIYDGRASADKS